MQTQQTDREQYCVETALSTGSNPVDAGMQRMIKIRFNFRMVSRELDAATELRPPGEKRAYIQRRQGVGSQAFGELHSK